MRDRLAQARQAIEVIRAANFYDRFRLRRLYKEGATLEELKDRALSYEQLKDRYSRTRGLVSLN